MSNSISEPLSRERLQRITPEPLNRKRPEHTPPEPLTREHSQRAIPDAIPLRDCVRQSIEKYFSHLDGQPISDLYNMVLAEIEEPLLQTVMRFMGGNQTKVALCLGLSRGTLRKKLAQYGLFE